MPTIQISRPHRLPPAAARAQVSDLAEQLQSSLDVSCRWEGDTLHFSRSGASGVIVVQSESIEVQIKLSAMLRPLAGKVERTVIEYLDQGLAAD